MTYSIKDLQQRYGVGEHTALGWIRSGLLRAIDVRRAGSRRPKWRVTQEALDAFEIARTPVAPAPRVRKKRLPANIIQRY